LYIKNRTKKAVFKLKIINGVCGMRIEKRKINDLKCIEQVAINEKDIEKIERAIRETDKVAPLIINSEGFVICGNKRFKVLKELGVEEIDVITINFSKAKSELVNLTQEEMEDFIPLNDDEIRLFIRNAKWIFAKTYADKFPHEYCLRKNMDEKAFERFVKHIRIFGYVKYFFRKPMVYFDFDGYKYWTMGDTLKNTILVNRAVIENGR